MHYAQLDTGTKIAIKTFKSAFDRDTFLACHPSNSSVLTAVQAKDFKNLNKIFYAFVGQNATTGSPHPITGCLSMYGDLVAFSSMKKRDHFVAEYYDQCNPSRTATKTNKHSAKTDYCAGMSKHNYAEYLQYVDSTLDENYDSFFQVEEI